MFEWMNCFDDLCYSEQEAERRESESVRTWPYLYSDTLVFIHTTHYVPEACQLTPKHTSCLDDGWKVYKWTFGGVCVCVSVRVNTALIYFLFDQDHCYYGFSNMYFSTQLFSFHGNIQNIVHLFNLEGNMNSWHLQYTACWLEIQLLLCLCLILGTVGNINNYSF